MKVAMCMTKQRSLSTHVSPTVLFYLKLQVMKVGMRITKQQVPLMLICGGLDTALTLYFVPFVKHTGHEGGHAHD